MKQLSIIICILSCSIGFSQKSVPNTTLFTLEGKPLYVLDEISKDKITVLSFWATWCVPCINELDAISEIYDEWQQSANVELIAISTDDSRTQKRIRPMINGKDWPYKILLDKNQEFKRALNISTIPQTYVLKGAEIIYIHSGYSPGVEDELFKVIQENKK
tara:strand:- start:8460 stop:8942 length:483 start_codon:yes stop_codon:yes gene_type:complete